MRKKETPTINVISQLSDLMLGRVIFPKYIDPCHLGILPLILHGPHFLIGLMHLNILSNMLIKHFSHMLALTI